MNKPPYTLQEAQKICTDFQYLTVKSLAMDVNTPVQCVAVTPFDQYNKERFIMYYFLLNDAESALNHEYNGLLYDVEILSRAEDDIMVHENIYSWLSKNNSIPLHNMEIITETTLNGWGVNK